MRAVFQKLERCRHRPDDRLLGGLEGSRHGWNGWLQTEKAIPGDALRDIDLVRLVESCAVRAAQRVGGSFAEIASLAENHADPNDWRRVSAAREGVYYVPLTTAGGHRTGTRERLLDVAKAHPDQLHIELDAHATQVVIEQGRATGVNYLKGPRLYRAFDPAGTAAGEPRFAEATHEVILAGGAFNSPQLLMLSGIGPPDELERHGIPVRVPLPGVGKNLQDRYEVGMVYDVGHDLKLLEGSQFRRDDPQCATWEQGKGLYTSNGALVAVIRKSAPRQPVPDLFCFSLVGEFGGYAPNYSQKLLRHDRITWAVLKGHTNNRGGEVRLRSGDPLDPPDIHFHYFEEGSPRWQEDLDAVVDGVKFVRDVMDRPLRTGLVRSELAPGVDCQSDEALRDFVRANAWGHHASCTCPIGARDEGGVIDSQFRVHGVERLRVVDASVFPRIPGLFIVSAVYMVGEKAAAAML
jgi:choline dehydrogenase-like flavoprotein